MIKPLNAACGAALALMMSNGAMARPLNATDAPMTASVTIADLRLETEAGRRIAHARLERAAEAVCGPTPSSIRDLVRLQQFDACVRGALKDADARLADAAGLQHQASTAEGQALR